MSKIENSLPLKQDWVNGIAKDSRLYSQVLMAQHILTGWTHKQALLEWGDLEELLYRRQKESAETDAYGLLEPSIDQINHLYYEEYPPFIAFLSKHGGRLEIVYALLCIKLSIEVKGRLGLRVDGYGDEVLIEALRAGYHLVLQMMLQEIKLRSYEVYEAKFESLRKLASNLMSEESRKKSRSTRRKNKDEKEALFKEIYKRVLANNPAIKGNLLFDEIEKKWEESNATLKKFGSREIHKLPKRSVLAKMRTELLKKGNLST